jgi:uncharacterized membrane protein
MRGTSADGGLLRRLRARASGDEGQVMVLALAFGVLALLLVGVVTSATAVHLERKRLLALADLAALEAADAMDPAHYYADDETGALVVLSDADVRAAVEAYLRDAPAAARFDDLTVEAATSADGRTAVVTLRAVADVPLLSTVTALWSDGIELVVTSRARAG